MEEPLTILLKFLFRLLLGSNFLTASMLSSEEVLVTLRGLSDLVLFLEELSLLEGSLLLLRSPSSIISLWSPSSSSVVIILGLKGIINFVMEVIIRVFMQCRNGSMLMCL